MNKRDREWVAGCLRTVPAGDVNFESSLERATVAMLQNALESLKRRPEGNGSRMTAILRELRRREKKPQQHYK